MRFRQAKKIVKQFIVNSPQCFIDLGNNKLKQTVQAFKAEIRFNRYVRRYSPDKAYIIKDLLIIDKI